MNIEIPLASKGDKIKPLFGKSFTVTDIDLPMGTLSPRQWVLRGLDKFGIERTHTFVEGDKTTLFEKVL
ncbi:hypothetical protein [Mycobacterium sp.]|uniref:hypothetical protein n=1 Tax=Mycobacterium sp. TaxID=1785 RepID=UPI001201B878|nr:hypothetical protein [Mycobacterium sp.]TAM63541.1 MAG: hypothetical protein EPN51_26595 [Mycobacterium sp.]